MIYYFDEIKTTANRRFAKIIGDRVNINFKLILKNN